MDEIIHKQLEIQLHLYGISIALHITENTNMFLNKVKLNK